MICYCITSAYSAFIKAPFQIPVVIDILPVRHHVVIVHAEQSRITRIRLALLVESARDAMTSVSIALILPASPVTLQQGDLSAKTHRSWFAEVRLTISGESRRCAMSVTHWSDGHGNLHHGQHDA